MRRWAPPPAGPARAAAAGWPPERRHPPGTIIAPFLNSRRGHAPLGASASSPSARCSSVVAHCAMASTRHYPSPSPTTWDGHAPLGASASRPSARCSSAVASRAMRSTRLNPNPAHETLERVMRHWEPPPAAPARAAAA